MRKLFCLAVFSLVFIGAPAHATYGGDDDDACPSCEGEQGPQAAPSINLRGMN